MGMIDTYRGTEAAIEIQHTIMGIRVIDEKEDGIGNLVRSTKAFERGGRQSLFSGLGGHGWK